MYPKPLKPLHNNRNVRNQADVALVKHRDTERFMASNDSSALNPLQRKLRRELPAAIADVLLPALTWRISKRRVTISVSNPLWREVFDQYASKLCQQTVESSGRQLTVLSPDPLENSHDKRKRTFKEFLTDPGNQFALATCRSICDAPGMLHNPLYIYGPPGVGKSHLISAIVHHFHQSLGNESAVYWSGREFVDTIVHQLAQRDQGSLHPTLQQASLIAVDDLEEIGDRAVAQEELYLLINHALEMGQQLVFGSRLPPRRIAHIEDRVSTRLSWGLCIGIDPPANETKSRFLRSVAGSFADDLSSNEISNLLRNYGNDMHHVLELGKRLATGERPEFDTPRASFDRILATVADSLGIRAGDIAGKGRQRQLVQARQASLLLGRLLTNHSLVALGGMVGGRDHSTVLHSLRQAQLRIDEDAQFAAWINDLQQEILSGH